MPSPALGIGMTIRTSPICGNRNANGASPILGTGHAARGAYDAATTAPTNPQMAPAGVITHSSRRTIAMIQALYRHHSLRRRCVLQTRATLQTLAARANHAATTIQHWLRHHSHRRRCIIQNKATLHSLAARANHAATTIQQCILHHLYLSSKEVTTSHKGYLSSPLPHKAELQPLSARANLAATSVRHLSCWTLLHCVHPTCKTKQL